LPSIGSAIGAGAGVIEQRLPILHAGGVKDWAAGSRKIQGWHAALSGVAAAIGWAALPLVSANSALSIVALIVTAAGTSSVAELLAFAAGNKLPATPVNRCRARQNELKPGSVDTLLHPGALP
jgi:hypothetical protein